MQGCLCSIRSRSSPSLALAQGGHRIASHLGLVADVAHSDVTEIITARQFDHQPSHNDDRPPPTPRSLHRSFKSPRSLEEPFAPASRAGASRNSQQKGPINKCRSITNAGLQPCGRRGRRPRAAVAVRVPNGAALSNLAEEVQEHRRQRSRYQRRK